MRSVSSVLTARHDEYCYELSETCCLAASCVGPHDARTPKTSPKFNTSIGHHSPVTTIRSLP
jgi:hypothetical protein